MRILQTCLGVSEDETNSRAANGTAGAGTGTGGGLQTDGNNTPIKGSVFMISGLLLFVL